MGHIILTLHMSSNFRLSPGHCECCVMVTLDSILFRQRLLMFVFGENYLVWTQTVNCVLGTYYNFSSVLSYLVCWQMGCSQSALVLGGIVQGLVKIWAEFTFRNWSSVPLALSFLVFTLRHFPAAFQWLTYVFYFFSAKRWCFFFFNWSLVILYMGCPQVKTHSNEKLTPDVFFFKYWLLPRTLLPLFTL